MPLIHEPYKMHASLKALLLILFSALLTACGGGSGGSDSSGGNANLSINLGQFSATSNNFQPASVTQPAITRVDVNLTRTGFNSISKSLTITNNIASGTISNLAAGYWHVVVNIYSGDTLLYTGSTDAKIIAGKTTNCGIEFDAVGNSSNPVDGSLELTAGINKVPGFNRLLQSANFIAQDTVNNKIYIVDTALQLIGVYDATTMIRQYDIDLPAIPSAVVADPAGNALLLGFTTGKLYRINMTSGALSLVSDTQMNIAEIVPLAGSSVLLIDQADSSWNNNLYKVVDTSSGQITNTSTGIYDQLGKFVYNPATSMLYATSLSYYHGNVYRASVSAEGVIGSFSYSYHESGYYYGSRVFLLDSARIVAPDGTIFTSSSTPSQDLLYSGNIGFSSIDLANDSTFGKVYSLNNNDNGTPQVQVIDLTTLFPEITITLPESTPARIFNTADNIIVFVTESKNPYAKVYNKTELGIQ